MIRSILNLNRRSLLLTQQYSTVKPYEVCESEEQENSTIEKKNSPDSDYWAQQLASGEHYSIIKYDENNIDKDHK